MLKFFVFLAFISDVILLRADELWEKDLSSEMKIGLSTTGYHSVDLRCDAENFAVNVTLDDDFEGVIYTRGTFNDKKLPCFKRHDQVLQRNNGKIIIGLRIPFTKCYTVMDVAESCFSNTLVVQHDSELIMPGDAAFSLQCAFTPEFKVSSNMSSPGTPSSSPEFKSKIILVNADPAEREPVKNGKYKISSNTENVSFSPKFEGTNKKNKDKVNEEL